MSVLFPQTYQYREFISGEYIIGKYQSVYASELSDFSGNIQPASQKEINSLDIGRQNRGIIKIYTDKVFNICTEGSLINGDIIVFDDNEFEVIKLDNNKGSLLPHRRYFAELRINDDLGETE